MGQKFKEMIFLIIFQTSKFSSFSFPAWQPLYIYIYNIREFRPFKPKFPILKIFKIGVAAYAATQNLVLAKLGVFSLVN